MLRINSWVWPEHVKDRPYLGFGRHRRATVTVSRLFTDDNLAKDFICSMIDSGQFDDLTRGMCVMRITENRRVDCVEPLSDLDGVVPNAGEKRSCRSDW